MPDGGRDAYGIGGSVGAVGGTPAARTYDKEHDMSARRLGAAATLAFPITILVGDFFRIRAEEGMFGDGDTVESVVSQLEAIEASSGSFAVASWMFYAAAILTIPMVLFLWRLAVDRSPRWAWAAGVLGACSVIGQIAHCMGYFAPIQAYAGGDHELGAQALIALNSSAYGLAVFAPYLLGMSLFPPVAAIALRRAQVLPLWAMVAVLVGSVLFVSMAGLWWVTALWGAALIAGLAPAAVQGLRSAPTVSAVREPAAMG